MTSTGPAAPPDAARHRTQPLREIHYRIDAPARGHFPGHHPGVGGDGGHMLRGHAALLDAPDARRLDLHASLRDPFGNWIVRVYSQRKSISVTMVADLSASMTFAGRRRRLDVLADFVQCLARSAWRTGDSFGFIGCDDDVRPDAMLLQTRRRGAGDAFAARLRKLMLADRASAAGLEAACRHLGRSRALVFLVSDFHLANAEIGRVLASLARHDVVPVVLWDALEFAPDLPAGLLPMTDPESGRERLVWWRPALRRRWIDAREDRRAELTRLFRARRLRPCFMENGFDADRITRHFHA